MDGAESIRYRDVRSTSTDDHDYELWHPMAMALSSLVAVGLIVSWLFQPGRAYWDHLDEVFFRQLNGTLEWGTAWQSIWAVANWRPFDGVVWVILCVILFATVKWRFPKKPFHAAASIALLVIVTLGASELVSELLIDRVLGYHRGSPTRALDGEIYRLNSLITWVECKDYSEWSFPGDHGFVLFMCAFYVTYLGRKRVALMAWLVAIVFSLPRMISGAHWLTDILVGSGTMALVTSALFFATPLHDYLLSFVPKGKLLADFSDLAAETVSVPVPVRRATAEVPTSQSPSHTHIG